MPDLNPNSSAGSELRTLYRGGVFCSLEKTFFEAGYLLSNELGSPARLWRWKLAALS